MSIRYLFLMSIVLTGNHVIAQSAEVVSSQKRDSLRLAYLEEAAMKFPVLRQASLSTDYISTGKIKDELYGKSLYSGSVNIIRTNAMFNLPIVKWKKNSLTASFSYSLQSVSISQVNSNQFPDTNMTVKSNTIGLTLTYIHADSLFGKPVVFIASALGLSGNGLSVQKLSWLAGATFTIRQSQSSMLRLGIILSIDPSSKIPLIPLINYWHNWQSRNLDLFIDLPTRVALRKGLSSKSSLSIGTYFTGTTAFLSYNNPSIPNNITYAMTEIRTGPGFEYRMSKKVIVGVNAGMLTPISARGFGRNEKSDNYFLRSSMSSRAYLNIGISFLPFLK